MLDVLFYVFSAITLVTALLMVLSPNAVNGALCMILSFVGTAALFVLLEAYFIAVLQVLVYAGAVMVLFLFIIMLLNVEKGEGGGYLKDRISLAASIVGFALLAVLVAAAFGVVAICRSQALARWWTTRSVRTVALNFPLR